MLKRIRKVFATTAEDTSHTVLLIASSVVRRNLIPLGKRQTNAHFLFAAENAQRDSIIDVVFFLFFFLKFNFLRLNFLGCWLLGPAD